MEEDVLEVNYYTIMGINFFNVIRILFFVLGASFFIL